MDLVYFKLNLRFMCFLNLFFLRVRLLLFRLNSRWLWLIFTFWFFYSSLLSIFEILPVFLFFLFLIFSFCSNRCFLRIGWRRGRRLRLWLLRFLWFWNRSFFSFFSFHFFLSLSLIFSCLPLILLFLFFNSCLSFIFFFLLGCS